MFKPLDADTYTEFQYRLKWSKLGLEYNPKDAVPMRLGSAYRARAGAHYCCALYCLFLQDPAGFKSHLTATLADIKTAIPIEQQNLGNFAITDEWPARYALCSYAFVAGDMEEVNATCQTIAGLKQYEKSDNFAAFYHALAHLWLDMPEKALACLPDIEKTESRKNSYMIAGTADVIRALASKDMPALIHAFDVALQEQRRRAKAPRSYLYNNLNGFMWLAGLELAIVALKYGLDVTPHLSHNRNVLKVKTESPLDRTELPANKRFNVPVEYIPEPILAPWRQYFNG